MVATTALAAQRRLSMALLFTSLCAVLLAVACMSAPATPEPPTNAPAPGASRPGMRVFNGLDVKVEYPEDWTQMAGDFGSLERYGVLLISPNGSEVFVNVNERQIEILREDPADSDEIAELLSTGVEFREPPTPPQ